MSEARHTPTPYVLDVVENGGVLIRTTVRSGDKHPVAEIWHNGDDPLRTGAFIVRACNGFDGLVSFAREIIGFAFDGSDADGASIQALAETYGLIVETKYDPERHGPSMDAEPGDAYFMLAGPLAEPAQPETKAAQP